MIPKNKILSILSTFRPHHWVKNLIIYAPVFFSGRFTQANLMYKATLAFICFCIISSAIYIINDVCDKSEDQWHTNKRRRPIANGDISSHTAIAMSIILIIIGLSLTAFLNRFVLIYLLAYIIINIAYSLVLKHIAIIDVLTISLGFVLRILTGGVAVSVEPSYWLVLCTVMISIFLGFTKRRVELVSVTNEQNNSRPVLNDYSVTFLDHVISIVTGATILAYALYTVDQHTQKLLGTNSMFLTLPFVIYGLLRYIYIIYHLKKETEPVDTLIRDIPSVLNFLLWAVTSLIIVKYGNKIILF